MLDKKTTAAKAHWAGAGGALATLATLGAALATGQVDVPPEAEVTAAAGALIAAAAAGATAWAGAYVKRNWPK